MKANSRPERILLIADLHLEEARPGLTRAFHHFLGQHASGASALYILGDLFNLWIGDDDDRPLNREVSAALRALTTKGTAVYLMHGNRDFLLGQDFAAASGAVLLDDTHLLYHHDEVFLLSHGDALCTRDTGYQQFRAQVRQPAWQQRFLAGSLAERRAFAEQARATSSSMNSSKPEDIMDVSPEAVQELMQGRGLSTLIHGHTHRPALHEFQLAGRNCRRIVLGDWGDSLWYLTLEDGQAQLREEPIDTA